MSTKNRRNSRYTLNMDNFTFWLSLFDTLCWPVCFWWMHRISTRQDSVLEQLRAQSERIERLSREEHQLIKEVHPVVGEIREDVVQVKQATCDEESAGEAGAPRR